MPTNKCRILAIAAAIVVLSFSFCWGDDLSAEEKKIINQGVEKAKN